MRILSPKTASSSSPGRHRAARQPRLLHGALKIALTFAICWHTAAGLGELLLTNSAFPTTLPFLPPQKKKKKKKKSSTKSQAALEGLSCFYKVTISTENITFKTSTHKNSGGSGAGGRLSTRAGLPQKPSAQTSGPLWGLPLPTDPQLCPKSLRGSASPLQGKHSWIQGRAKRWPRLAFPALPAPARPHFGIATPTASPCPAPRSEGECELSSWIPTVPLDIIPNPYLAFFCLKPYAGRKFPNKAATQE